MGSLGKLLAAGAPLIVAVLTQIGINVNETEVAAWIEFVIWVMAILSMLVPSFRAWLNHREDAE